MERTEAIRRRREAGAGMVAVLPGRYPRPVLEACGLLPVEIWDPPGPIGRAAGHLQPFVCSVAHRALELLLRQTRTPDAILFPHLCDSMQNTFTVLRDCVGTGGPCLTFYPPRNPNAAGAREYVAAQCRRLAAALEPVAQRRCTDADLARALAAHDAADERVREAYAQRAAGELHVSNRAFYEWLRRREYLPAAQFAGTDLPDATGASGAHKVLLSGLLPDRDLLGLLDDAGVAVVEDDLLSCGRRLARTAPAGESDPWAAMAGRLLDLPPCSSIGSTVAARVEFLKERLAACGARSVLFHNIKFCEVEAFYHPYLVAALRAEGVATLVVETELHQPQHGQVATRLEAFLEMIA